MTATTICPHCGVELERHVPVGATPGTPVGHVSICASCNQVAVVESGPFGDVLRKPTPQEYQRINDELVLLAGELVRRLEEET